MAQQERRRLNCMDTRGEARFIPVQINNHFLPVTMEQHILKHKEHYLRETATRNNNNNNLSAALPNSVSLLQRHPRPLDQVCFYESLL